MGAKVSSRRQRLRFGTSASTGEHIAELRQKIQEEVRAMPQVRVLFSADYLAVKDEMETLTAAHISHEEFVRVCERHGVSDAKDQDTLLDLLHDLGTVLYFHDADGNPLLPALGVLNRNIQSCRLADRARVLRWDAAGNLNCLADGDRKFDLAFMDPPYCAGMIAPALRHLADSRCLEDKARIVVEHAAEEATDDALQQALHCGEPGK